MDILIVVKALLAGVLLGAVFSAVDLPIPAPPTLAGVSGIVGIYVGFKLVQYLGTHGVL